MDNEIPAIEERRAYSVLRDDLLLTRTSYMALSALGYSRLSILCTEQPDLMNGYDRDMQPKLALRAKNAGALSKAEEALRVSGIPFVTVEHGGQAVGIFLPPMPRSALPKEVANLQLFSERRHAVDEEETPVAVGEDDRQTCPIIFRSSLEAPLGKMIAQVGHAAWGAGIRSPSGVRILVLGIGDQDVQEARQAGGWQAIVDAGRTVFGEPTLTCAWGGYIPEPVETVTLETSVVLNTPLQEPKP